MTLPLKAREGAKLARLFASQTQVQKKHPRHKTGAMQNALCQRPIFDSDVQVITQYILLMDAK